MCTPENISSNMDLRLKLCINLQNFSAIAVVVKLWEKVKSLVNQYFDNWKNHPFIAPDNELWQWIVSLVYNKVGLLKLSEDLSTKVNNLIEPIGDKIFYWGLFLLRKLCLDPKYTHKIYWTQYGSIDECKIFESYWVKMHEKTDEPWIASNQDIILLSCLFARKDFIKKNISEFRKGMELFLAPLKVANMNKIKTYGIIVLRLYVEMAKNIKELALHMYKTAKKFEVVAYDLFSWSLFEDYYESAKYFWSKLDEREKKVRTKQKAKAIISHSRSYERHGNEKETEIFIFLVNKMDPDLRHHFIWKYLEKMFVFCSYVWPYNEVINSILEECLSRYSPLDQTYFFNFLLSFISKDQGEYQTKKPIVQESIGKEVLPVTLKKMSKDDKINKFVEDKSFVQKMFDSFDVPVLSAILNDNDLADYRDEILDGNHLKFKDLIKSRDFQKLNQFMKNVFISFSAQKQFKLKMNFFEELLIQGDYFLADRLLAWISDSADERISIKKQINAMKLCYEFTNIFQIKRFLQWYFDNELERDHFKQTLKNDEFIRHKIIHIYKENDVIHDSRCFDFLKWISGSEAEAIELKNRLIFDENSVRKFSAFLPSPESFKKINELGLSLSLAPDEELDVKQKIISNKDEWIFTYTVSRKKC